MKKLLHTGNHALLVLAAVVCNMALVAIPLIPAEVSHSENTHAGDVRTLQAAIVPPLPENMDREAFSSLRQYADEYGVDYRLVLAIIRQESRFDPEALSDRGASGMMQIMPVTNAEITSQLEILDPGHPRENLRAGIYYFAKLSRLFKNASPDDRMSLALAAYNAGPSRVYDAQEIAAYMGEDPSSWRAVAKALPLLSKRYYTLHALVWNDARPKYGYYGSSRQTITYVDRVMNAYATLRASVD
jgi:membrane-bound lytic murein transglycosylase MltF